MGLGVLGGEAQGRALGEANVTLRLPNRRCGTLIDAPQPSSRPCSISVAPPTWRLG